MLCNPLQLLYLIIDLNAKQVHSCKIKILGFRTQCIQK